MLLVLPLQAMDPINFPLKRSWVPESDGKVIAIIHQTVDLRALRVSVLISVHALRVGIRDERASDVWRPHVPEVGPSKEDSRSGGRTRWKYLQRGDLPRR